MSYQPLIYKLRLLMDFYQMSNCEERNARKIRISLNQGRAQVREELWGTINSLMENECSLYTVRDLPYTLHNFIAFKTY